MATALTESAAALLTKYKKLFVLGSLTVGVGGTIAYAQSLKKKQKPNLEEENAHQKVPKHLMYMIDIVGEDTTRIICLEPPWADLCDRMSDFQKMCKEEYKNFLVAVAGAIGFLVSLKLNGSEIKMGTPRMFRKTSHPIIEAVRTMRAVLQIKCPSALTDFDEIAAEVQRMHDDNALNIQLEAGSK